MSATYKDTVFVKELLAHEPVPSPETLEQAQEILTQAFQDLGMSCDVLSHLLLGVCHKVPTTAVPTQAVSLPGNGLPIFMYNPHFVIQLGVRGTTFVLAHEGGHLAYRHLYTDKQLRAHPQYTMGTETVLNHNVMGWLRRGMPTIVNADGTEEETGVNPKKVFEQYRKDLKGQEIEPVDYDTFTSSDLRCMTELSRMAKPPKPPKGSSMCVHVSGDGGQGEGEDGELPVDQGELDELVEDALHTMVNNAVNNDDKNSKDQLLKLEKMTEGSDTASKVWGNLGLGKLRGEAVTVRRVNAWGKFIAQKIGTLLEPGQRAKFPKKMIAIADEFDFELPLIFRGDETKKRGLVVTDTSGSMQSEVLEFVRRCVGYEDGLEIEYLNFDTCVYPVQADKPFTGGGGTDCQCVIDYVDTMGEEPDFVLMVTDGHMAPRRPSNIDKWVWLITPGGDHWPQTKFGMPTHELPDGDPMRAHV